LPVFLSKKDKFVYPSFSRKALGTQPNCQSTIKSQVPVGRFGKPSEIAKAAVTLASDDSVPTVGAEILIDGGRSLWSGVPDAAA
jgi:NAD(P)-dependent dehydrogenase (short-subunit alcohol dehydrogenase family)